MSNTLKFGNGEWYGKEGTILAYNDLNSNYKPLPFEFERPGTATRVNKEGLIEVVGNNEPRIDYKDNSEGALLLEPTRTNLVTYSNDFTNASWSGTFVGNNAISPDGTLNADKFVFTQGASYPQFYKSVSGLVIGQEYTSTIYIKKTENSSDFEINSSGIPFSPTNEWQRVVKTFTATSTTQTVLLNYVVSVGVGVVNEIYVAFAQVEQGSYATSYIPTSGGIATRNYDTMPTYLDVKPLNIGNSYTLFLDADLNVNDNNKVFGATNNSSDVISFTFRNNVGGIRLYNHIDASYPVSGITSSNNKFVIRVDGNSYKVFVQGSSLSGTLTTQRDLGSLNFYGQNTELKINNFTIDDTALSDAECEALTS